MEADMSQAVKQSDVYQDLLNLPENIIGEIISCETPILIDSLFTRGAQPYSLSWAPF